MTIGVKLFLEKMFELFLGPESGFWRGQNLILKKIVIEEDLKKT